MLTSSKDWNVIMWDMASDIDPPQRKTTIRFDASVSSASFHPRNRLALLAYASCSHSPPFSQIILALLQSGDAYLVDLRKKYRGRVELEEVQDDSDEESGAPSRYALPLLPFSSCAYSACDRSAMTVAQFDPTGRHIFVGTSTGSILVFNTRTKTVSHPFILPLRMI
jgi:COMPASS component SWD1